jgi:choline transport protein
VDKSVNIEQQPVHSTQLAGTTLVSSDIRKTIGPLTMLALCFNICSSWAGLSTSVQIALLAGGPMTLLYGVIVTTAIYLCISLSLAELASVYPTAGGQYHFSSILAPEKLSRQISYVCGFITAFYWIATGAAVSIIVATQIATLATYYNPTDPGEPWQLFLIYQALGLSALFYNIFFIKRLDVTHTIGCEQQNYPAKLITGYSQAVTC